MNKNGALSDRLPDELTLNIFQHINQVKDVCSLSLVNKQFYRVTRDDSVFYKMLEPIFKKIGNEYEFKKPKYNLYQWFKEQMELNYTLVPESTQPTQKQYQQLCRYNIRLGAAKDQFYHHDTAQLIYFYSKLYNGVHNVIRSPLKGNYQILDLMVELDLISNLGQGESYQALVNEISNRASSIAHDALQQIDVDLDNEGAHISALMNLEILSLFSLDTPGQGGSVYLSSNGKSKLCHNSLSAATIFCLTARQLGIHAQMIYPSSPKKEAPYVTAVELVHTKKGYTSYVMFTPRYQAVPERYLDVLSYLNFYSNFHHDRLEYATIKDVMFAIRECMGITTNNLDFENMDKKRHAQLYAEVIVTLMLEQLAEFPILPEKMFQERISKLILNQVSGMALDSHGQSLFKRITPLLLLLAEQKEPFSIGGHGI